MATVLAGCSQILAASAQAAAFAADKCSSSSSFTGSRVQFQTRIGLQRPARSVGTRAAAEEECNDPTCAPEKEVGSVSAGWEARERTQVAGTYPPRTPGVNPKTGRQWGYTDFDSAGQRNIYPVEPTIYVSDNVFSSNKGDEQSNGGLIFASALAAVAIFGAAVTLGTLSGSPSSPPTVAGTGEELAGVTVPPLSYYIDKFQAGSRKAPALVKSASDAVEAVASNAQEAVEAVVNEN